jgi:hypothetical protein
VRADTQDVRAADLRYISVLGQGYERQQRDRCGAEDSTD